MEEVTLKRRQTMGVTLVELLIGLVIVGIMLAAAGPGFSGMIDRNRVASQVNDFILAIQVARSEATRIGATVSIQAVGSSSSNEFGDGYCVVTGDPGNCSGAVVRRFDALSGGSTLNSVENVTTIKFNSLGALQDTGDAPLQFDLCNDSTSGRRIYVSLIGRAKAHSPDDLDVAKRPGC